MTDNKTHKQMQDELRREAEAQDAAAAAQNGTNAVPQNPNNSSIASREDDYRKQRFNRAQLSPTRADPMSLQTPLDGSGGYLDALKNSQLDRENAEIQQKIAMMREQQGDDQFLQHVAQAQKGMIEKTSTNGSGAPVAKKRNRWDDAAPVSDPNETPAAIGGSAFDTPAEVPINSSNGTSDQNGTATQSQQQQQKKRRRARWDQETPVQQGGPGGGPMDTPMGMPNMDTPMMGGVMDTPMGIGMPMDTPMGIGLPPGGTPSDNIGGGPPGTTPVATGANQIAVGATPTTVDLGQTPLGVGLGMMDTPIGLTPHPKDMTPDQLQAFRILRELDDRNRPLSDQELDQMFPPGYEVVPPPPGYDASAQRKINVFQTPLGSTPIGLTPGFGIGSTPADGGASLRDAHGVKDSDGSGGTGRFESTDADGMGGARGAGSSASQQLPEIKPEERHHFAPLLKGDSEDDLSPDEAKQRRIMRLLLKIKNGDPAVRRSALKEITNKAREFGAGPLFDQILPLMMISSLEEQERHLLVKVIDRILHRLGDLVRPFVHKILVVIEPLLIDEDHVARVEGREIIANLSKSAGLATMISTMRPDLDHPDEYVRNTTARAFAVVASALGIPSLLLFLKAVCNSKKTWQGRHTGVKIIQQIAILMGIQILPYLKQLVDLCAPGLSDEQRKVRTMSALALAALAEASSPYGLESFDQVLRPLWRGIREHQGKDLGSFFKCIGYILGLFPPDYASHYIRELGPVLIREFGSSDEEMRRIVLKVVHQCVSTEGVDSSYIQDELLFPFFRNFWVPRMALDRRNSRQLVETTVALAEKVGGSEICSRILHDLKDSNELYRSIVLETIALIVDSLGVADFDSRTEELLVDGSIYCFHESSAGSGAAADIATSIGPDGQPITNSSSSGSAPANLMLNSVSSIIHALGSRFKPYVPQITGVIRFRLNTPQPMVRKLAADLISRIAAVLKICGEEGVLLHFGLFLYEYLGEEYPDVLASIIGALKSIVSVVGQDISELDGSGAAYKANNSSSGSGSLARMTPPIKDLLPRLTPILKNRHEKVQEQCISLVGRIADKGSELAPPREWNRICFDLVELLKATKKSIRRAAVNTFGLIASAIGPHDVLATLINNLKVQERQMRVCTCIALGIIGETCGPFTILPAILNEYKTADLNVQHGVLKTLQFLLQYIGSLSKDYIYAITPLLEDALTDRDSVHRQMGIVATMHLTLGVQGLGREDACIHLLNYVFPNAFETTPHLIQGVFGCFDAMRVTLGPTKMLQYLLQGLFHPARRVREVYWKLYNQLYIGAQEGMVPSYPKLRDQVFHRPQLELLL